MAVRRSQNWINQQRVDVPHLRSIESAVRNDFDELFVSLIQGENQSYVIRGMEIEMAGSIGASANGLQLIVANSSILHGKSNESGTFFQIASGEANQVLSATTNTRVEGSFTPSALNYVSIEFTRQVDDSTTSQQYIWNATTKNEITKTLPLAETLDYKIVISSSVFASNVLPIAIVETDSSNNVLNVQDRRPMLFRLGTAGSATPDPFYEYSWTNHTEGRSENFWQSSSSSISPFRGGDKQILTFKENDEAIKTELKQIKGTTYWYSPNSAGSIAGLRYDLGNTIMTGRGSVTHNNGNPGQINWDEDIFLTVVSTRLRYKLEANVATTDIDLDDRQVAYVKLIRDVDVIPQLIFTNGATQVSSVGSITWTTDLEAGDYVKVASEGDGSYYQILSVDSSSQVTLTENFGGTSTGINGIDAKIAYGVYRTDAAPSTDRHIRTANIEDVPFDADTYWLMLRTDSGGQARVYIRYLNGELEQGETIQISDQVPAALLAYMGSASDSDVDPDYSTSATGTKNTQTNYNSIQGENLTVRASKLTSMLADKAQDKTIQLVSNHTSVSNTTNATNQEITFSGGSGAATVIMPSSTDNGTIGLSGTLTLAANQVAYYQVNRNAIFNLADLSALTVSDIDLAPLDENTFIFAYRLSGTTVYLWNNQVLETGSSIALSVLRGYVQQNKTVKLVRGGTWSWNAVSNELTNSASAYLQVGGLAENVNEIAAQTISLTADGICAYVTLKRTAGASTLSVSVADIASVPQDDHTFIIARRIGNDVVIGTSSTLLKSGEFLELDGALAEINRYHEQLAVKPENPISKRVKISGSDVSKLSGSQLSLEQNNLLLSFQGVVIDFSTGNIFESDGLTPFLGGANDFTPFTIGAGEYFYYSVSLLPNTVNADNTISGQILIIPASASNATLSSAPKAPFPSTGIKLANVLVQESGGSIANIDYANLTTLGVGGSGSGGSGDASTLLGRMEDLLDESFYRYLEPNVFSKDGEDKVGSSDASFSVVDKTYNFTAGQFLQSYELLDPEFLTELNDILKAQVALVFDSGNEDPNPTVELSNNGVDFQTVTMDRLSSSNDTFVGELVFDLTTLVPQNLNEVTGEDSQTVLDNAVTIDDSQDFTTTQTEVAEKITVSITKTGSPLGYLKINLHEDNAGIPGNVKYQALVDITTLVAGQQNVTIDVGRQVLADATKYHIKVETDQAYKDNYVAGTDEIAVGQNSTVPSMIYKVEGRALSLLMKYTASATSKLAGYGVYYGEEAQSVQRLKRRAVFAFDGTVNNLNEFQLPWDADPDFVEVQDRITGQVWGVPSFELQNNKVVFPVNFFDGLGEVYLVAKQVEAGSYDNNPENRKIIAENHLGSNDTGLDYSVAGRGPIVSTAVTATKVELTVDENFNLVIKEA